MPSARFVPTDRSSNSRVSEGSAPPFLEFDDAGDSPPEPEGTDGWLGTPAIETRAIHGGEEVDPVTGAIIAPLVQATTYVRKEIGGVGACGTSARYSYSRADNPTVAALERALGALEDAPPAVCCSSGLSALTTLLLGTLKAGDEVIHSEVIYGGSFRLLHQILNDFGITARSVDTSNAPSIAAAVNEKTRLILLESPGNPTLKLADIAGAAACAREAGAILAVDNTFLTGVVQRPLDLGADVVIYSTTKHIEGHNAAVGGAIVARDGRLLERLRFVRKTLGTIQSPFAAWLTLRGVKTLPVRIREHSRNAAEVAQWLEGHEAVQVVHYPGLRSFPQWALAQRQHGDGGNGTALHGGVLAFEVRGSTEDSVRVMNALRRCRLAESLCAVETLVTHPVTMTHGDVPREQRERIGISDGLIRLSVGLENPRDVIADLAQALSAISAERKDPAGREDGLVTAGGAQ